MHSLEFETWLKEGKKTPLRDNTVRMYRRYLKELPDVDLINMSEVEIRGILNSKLADFPNSIAKSAFMNYIEFLFSRISRLDTTFYENIRVKKNNIIANMEIPNESKEDYDLLDKLDDYYIDKDRFFRVWNAIDELKIKYIIILLYDGALRINELLKNDWKNIDEEGILVPKRIAKSHRNRRILWLMPESKEIVKKLKSKGVFSKSIKVSYYSVWYALSPRSLGDISINPHALRHTRLTDLAGEGMELGELQRRAGHSDSKITQQYISWTAKKHIMPIEKWCKEKNIPLL